MSDDTDDFEYPTLGRFRQHANSWQGRSDPGPDFHDLVIMLPTGTELDTNWGDPPPASALATLAAAQHNLPALKPAAVSAICAARQARLNWRAGPPPEAWSIIELRIDPAGAAWLTLHEYETDEYSAWMIRLDTLDATPIIRRRPHVAFDGAPGEAGELV